MVCYSDLVVVCYSDLSGVLSAVRKGEMRTATSEQQMAKGRCERQRGGANGNEEVRAANGNEEVRAANGTEEVRAAKGIEEVRAANGSEEVRAANGNGGGAGRGTVGERGSCREHEQGGLRKVFLARQLIFGTCREAFGVWSSVRAHLVFSIHLLFAGGFRILYCSWASSLAGSTALSV